MTIFLVRTWAGKSHSWLTPTTSSSRPRAKRISVAEGRRETIRMPGMYHIWKRGEGRGKKITQRIAGKEELRRKRRGLHPSHKLRKFCNEDAAPRLGRDKFRATLQNNCHRKVICRGNNFC